MVYIPLYNYHFKKGSVILHTNYYVAANQKGETVVTSTATHPPNADPPNATPVTYVIQENITFSPNNMRDTGYYFLDSGTPTSSKDQAIYRENKAFGIGFFAAIIIHGSHIELDMNGHTLEQSEEHYLRQRFFSLIELADSPFLSGQGPHDFTSKISPASHIVIKNGKFGLSSHHAIHGNNTSHISLFNLQFKEFEVAAIALNGSHDVHIRDIHIQKNKQDIPVLGLWSSGIFLFPYLRELWKKHGGHSIFIQGKTLQSRNLYREFIKTYQRFVKAFLSGNRNLLRYDSLFGNPSGITPGISYGIVLHERGVAVNGFPMECKKTSYNNVLENIVIENIKVHINEVPALSVQEEDLRDNRILQFMIQENRNNDYVSSKVQVDVVGSVFQTQHGDTITQDGLYQGNLIANTQLLISKAIHKGIRFEHPVRFNTITACTVDWVENGTYLADEYIDFVFQGDAMHHVIKGVIALKLDGLYDSRLENIRIQNIENQSPPLLFRKHMKGIDKPGSGQGDYYDAYEAGEVPSHAKAFYASDQKTMVRGISLACSHKVSIRNIEIQGLKSLSSDKIIEIDHHDRFMLPPQN